MHQKKCFDQLKKIKKEIKSTGRKKMNKKDNDPFGFNKAINWDKLEDPEVLKELEKLWSELPKSYSTKISIKEKKKDE